MKILICLSFFLALATAEARAEPQWLEKPLCKNSNLKEIETWGRAMAKHDMGGQTRGFSIEEIKYKHSVLRSKNDGFDKYEVVVMFTEVDEHRQESFEFKYYEVSIDYPSCK